jgi:hypothetical protein
MGNLHDHAVRELEFAGVEDDIRPSLLAAVDAFASYGHSGTSARVCADILNRLLRFKPLTAIGTTQDEWMPVADEMWQNRRRSTTFSRDGGRTWYDIDDPSLDNGDTW